MIIGRADADQAHLRELLDRPCGECGDVLHARAAFLVGDGEESITLCNACVVALVPEEFASHPRYFVGAWMTDEVAADRLLFSLELRRHHARGRVPLKLRSLFNPTKWASA